MDEIFEIIIGIKESEEIKEVRLSPGLWYVELYPYNLVGQNQTQYYVCAVIQEKQRMDSSGNKVEIFQSKYKTKKARPIIQVPTKTAEGFIFSFLVNSAINFGALYSKANSLSISIQEMEENLMALLYSNER